MDNYAVNLLRGYVYNVLKAHPAGIKEFELLKFVEKCGFPLFDGARFRSSLRLFQQHFFLFHILYQLQFDLLSRRAGDLHIHCLNIFIKPYQTKKTVLPACVDPLKAYYLDLSNCQGITQSQVDDMLDSFWRRFSNYQKREAAWKVLGLEPTASKWQIKARYKGLALEAHPDRGGDAVWFSQINQAATILLEKG